MQVVQLLWSCAVKQNSVTHEELWDFAQKVLSESEDVYRSSALSSIGLFVHPVPEKNYSPGCQNLWTFASTGGDSVTYNYLLKEPIVDPTAPVLMNVPRAYPARRVVVGSDLYDFLCLGCEIGYFYIEQYVYNSKKFVQMYENPEATWNELEEEAQSFNADMCLDADDSDSCSKQRELLARLSKHFNLHPWKNIATKLKELQRLRKSAQ
jgi:hypothetical protein